MAQKPAPVAAAVPQAIQGAVTLIKSNAAEFHNPKYAYTDAAMENTVSSYLSSLHPHKVISEMATRLSEKPSSGTVFTYGMQEFALPGARFPAKFLMILPRSSCTLDEVRLSDGRMAFIVEPGPAIFKFARLPAELRAIVFKFHYYRVDKIYLSERPGKVPLALHASPKPNQDLLTPFSLNKTIGAEARSAFFRYTYFVFTDTRVAAQFLSNNQTYFHSITRLQVDKWDDPVSSRALMKMLVLAKNLQLVGALVYNLKNRKQMAEASDVWLVAHGNSVEAVTKLMSIMGFVYCGPCFNNTKQWKGVFDCGCRNRDYPEFRKVLLAQLINESTPWFRHLLDRPT